MFKKTHCLTVAILFVGGSAALAQESRIVVASGLRSADDVRAIAAITTPDYSGVFVAEPSGAIFLDVLKDGKLARREVIKPGGGLASFRPLGLAYADSKLYAYDGVTRQIRVATAPGFDNWESQPFQARLREPSHLAVSPHGLVAVIDGEQLLFLQPQRKPIVYERSGFPQAAGLAFTAWNRINVLDKARGSLVSIVFSLYSDGEIKFLSEEETKAGVPEGQTWRSMDVHDGITYLATENNVYAFVAPALVPVMYQSQSVDGIHDFVITDDTLALTTGTRYLTLPRAVPVDLAFKAAESVSQPALLGFYGYLKSRDLLPVRRARAHRVYRTVEEFLFDQDVIISPRSQAASKIQVLEDQQKNAYRQSNVDAKQTAAKRVAQVPGGAARAAGDMVCSLNRELCAAGGMTGVKQDQELVIPDFAVQRSLSRERIRLERPLGSYLNDLVHSPGLRRLIDADFIRKLNPEIAGLNDEQIWSLPKGEVQIPVERWSLSAAVPVAEILNRDSDLWQMTYQTEGVFLRSRASFVTQAAKSMSHQGVPHADGAPQSEACTALSDARKKWFEHIKYPLKKSADQSLVPSLLNAKVRVGVLEFHNTVIAAHPIFSRDARRPVWHQFNDRAELVPVPNPQSFAATEPPLEDIEFYSAGAHHGTHVSALIAGRTGPCWSGLLPSSRLVLVDLGNLSDVQRNIDDAVREDVKVFNVSQTFSGAREELHTTVSQEGRALWVVAAGNDGINLDTIPDDTVPAFARWGRKPNVIVVTASDWEGNLIQNVPTPEGVQTGANHGKGYVDMIAPGQDVYSATEPNKYGRASGTSQAVPQVAAAAAILADQLGEHLTPGDVKARLIATADWVPAYAGQVWGGRLNFAAAVMFPDRDLVRTVTGAQQGKWFSIVPSGDVKFKVVNVPHYYERSDAEGASAPRSISLSRILSLRRLTHPTFNDVFRVVLRESGTDQLKILLEARLADGTSLLGGTQLIECGEYELLNPDTGAFTADNGCSQGISIGQIDTYVKGKAYQVKWGN